MSFTCGWKRLIFLRQQNCRELRNKLENNSWDCSISTFGCFHPSCRLCWLRKFMCLDLFFEKQNTASFSCSYRGCLWFVHSNCKWLLVMMIGIVATISLSSAGNQTCVGQRGVIKIVLADSILIFVNACQMSLKGGKQKLKYFFCWIWIRFPRDIFVNLFIGSGLCLPGRFVL